MAPNLVEHLMMLLAVPAIGAIATSINPAYTPGRGPSLFLEEMGQWFRDMGERNQEPSDGRGGSEHNQATSDAGRGNTNTLVSRGQIHRYITIHEIILLNIFALSAIVSN